MPALLVAATLCGVPALAESAPRGTVNAPADEGKGEIEFQQGRVRNRRVEIALTGSDAAPAVRGR